MIYFSTTNASNMTKLKSDMKLTYIFFYINWPQIIPERNKFLYQYQGRESEILYKMDLYVAI